MYSKYYKAPSLSRTMQSTFLGLNKNARIGDGEFADMTNMSSDYAPLLSPRAPRVIAQKAPTYAAEEVIVTEEIAEDGTVTEVETTTTKTVKQNLNGILGDVGFAAVWGGDFYYLGEKVEGLSLINGEKNLLAMGAYIIIYPDTMYYNTETGEYGYMDSLAHGKDSTAAHAERIIAVLENGATTLPCNITFEDLGKTITKWDFFYSTGGILNAYFAFGSLPKTSATLYYYDDTATELRVYNGELYYLYSGTATGYGAITLENVTWKKVPLEKVGFKITLDDLGISDMDLGKLWVGNIHTVATEDTVNGYVYFSGQAAWGLIDAVYSSSKPEVKNYVYGTRISEKNLPRLDFVCAHENRLWGCRYGSQVTGSDVNEIYCSALGDFKNWTVGTLAGDSYTASVGEYGAFTGCISYRGQLLFFKDNIVYRVTGDKPSNFQIEKISDSGLQSGCEKSLEIIDEVLYYKSRNGVFVYDGSLPQKISDALGNYYYTDAVAGKHFSKYYISMVHDGVRKLYVYDTRYGLWHAEDDIDARFFTEYEGALYAGVGNDIVCLSGTPAEIFSKAESEGEVTWSAESGDIGLSSPYQKYFHRLLLRMDMDVGSRVTVELACDGGAFTTAMDLTAPHKRSVLLPIVTPRCDHMRLRLSGKGAAKIYSLSYETETVGERPNLI